jgi:hypothetical protein
MTGERLAWFRVASHLSIPVEELAERITHREFLNWLEYLEWDYERSSKPDYYLAQIAAEVRRSYVKHGSKVKTADFLLKIAKKPVATDSKKAWLGFFNIKPEDN